jgi:hypothetical protein
LAGAIAEIDQEIDAAIERMDAEVVAGEATFCSLIDLLCTIPGVSESGGAAIGCRVSPDQLLAKTAVRSSS